MAALNIIQQFTLCVDDGMHCMESVLLILNSNVVSVQIIFNNAQTYVATEQLQALPLDQALVKHALGG